MIIGMDMLHERASDGSPLASEWANSSVVPTAHPSCCEGIFDTMAISLEKAGIIYLLSFSYVGCSDSVIYGAFHESDVFVI